MDAPADKRDRGWIAWLLAGLLVMGVMIVICGLVIFVATRPATQTVPPALQQEAAQALNNPAAASINLDQHYSSWYPPNGRDYAVTYGMVIFPQPSRSGNPIRDAYANVLPDKEMPALVYAPDGRDLSTAVRNPERSWYYIGEWDLFNCHPIDDASSWWQCTLIVGGNI